MHARLLRRQIHEEIHRGVKQIVTAFAREPDDALQISDANSTQTDLDARFAALHIVFKGQLQTTPRRPHARGIDARKQLRYGPTQSRMADLGRNLRQRHEHKSAFGHERVRDRQLRRVQHQIVVEQDVHVDQTWAVSECSQPSHALLHLLDKAQQLVRRQLRAGPTGDVDKGRLLGVADRRGLIAGRDLLDRHLRAQ